MWRKLEEKLGRSSKSGARSVEVSEVFFFNVPREQQVLLNYWQQNVTLFFRDLQVW